MQPHFDIDDGFQAVECAPEVGNISALVHGEPVGAGEVHQKEIVLFEIVAKGRFRERTETQLTNELMLAVGSPVVVTTALEIVECRHVHLPGRREVSMRYGAGNRVRTVRTASIRRHVWRGCFSIHIWPLRAAAAELSAAHGIGRRYVN